MPYAAYRELPLEVLYELLTGLVKDMLKAYDANEYHLITFKAVRKQVEVILTVIEEKSLEKENSNSGVIK